MKYFICFSVLIIAIQGKLVSFDINDLNSLEDGETISEQEQVRVNLYYECFCPFSMDFYINQFVDTIRDFGSAIDVHSYPYGNAKVNKSGDTGCLSVKCQHGAEECYGNKLHACADDIIGNLEQSSVFNACMMGDDQENSGSDDKAADNCGKKLNIDSKAIKSCAKGIKGDLVTYAMALETQRVKFPGVPFLTVNGKEANSENFKDVLCKAFKAPPPPCNKH